MKKQFISFTTFTRIERMGLVALCSVILLLLIARVCMPYFIHPVTNPLQEQKLVAAWSLYKFNQSTRDKYPSIDSVGNKTKDYQDVYDDNPKPLPAIININTADSVTLVRLRGIGPKTAWKIINYRTTKGPFTNIIQLKEICKMPGATFELLKNHLTAESGKNK